MKTAVEWLVEQIINKLGIRIENTADGCELFEKTKEMEKQQIIDAYIFSGGTNTDDEIKEAEKYYNETFKSE